MKTAISVLIISCLSIQIGLSQENMFGVIGGVNYSTILGDNGTIFTTDISPRVSYQIGIYSEFQISEKLSISPQLQFASYGSRNRFNISDIEPLEPDVSENDIESVLKKSVCYSYI